MARLLEYLDRRVQTFVTTSKKSHFEGPFSGASYYEVSNGLATEEREHVSSIAVAGSVT